MCASVYIAVVEVTKTTT